MESDMRNMFLFLVLLIALCSNSHAQISDTTYFDKHWQVANIENCKYFGISNIQDSIIIVTSFNLDGIVMMIGKYDFTEHKLGSKNGEETFYSYGRISKTVKLSNGLRHGETRNYFPASNNLKSIELYENGKRVKKFRPEKNKRMNREKSIIYYSKTRFSPFSF